LELQETLTERRLTQDVRPNDVRDEYDRDEARLIHSAAFRRLQSKTQVLGLGESDFYRTRLTHSMEVAQIGRGMVQSLKKKYRDFRSILPKSSLIGAICLAHDIGHPPFGHGGEVALNYCMREYGGFEGNGQTLRILGKLDKYTDGYGMNATRRMMLGVLKYPLSYSQLVKSSSYALNEDRNLPYWLFEAKKQKPPKCYHDCDQDLVNFIFSIFDEDDVKRFTAKSFSKDKSGNDETCKHLVSNYKSLDASIMNLADNISYSLHDLEDALSLKMITESDWEVHFEGKHCLFSDCSVDDNILTYEDIKSKLFGESHERKNAIGTLVNLMITRTQIVDNGSGCIDPLLKYKVELVEDVEALRNCIFELVVKKVIQDKNVQQLEFKGQKIIIELFQALATDPNRFLPEVTLTRWNKQQNNEGKKRVICDFVAGMTDDYATRFYEKLFFPNKGSIFDRL
jgi:dGTPase